MVNLVDEALRGPLFERPAGFAEELLTKVEPFLRIVLRDRVPIDHVENPRERAERSLERRLIRRVLRQ